jgi:hypothetical protein
MTPNTATKMTDTDDQHEPVQPNLLFSDFGDWGMQIQLTHCGTTWQIIDCPRHGGDQGDKAMLAFSNFL